MEILINDIKKMCCALLENTGVSAEDSEIIFSNLLDEQLLDKNSQGFYYIPNILSAAKSMDHSKKIIEISNTHNFATKVDAQNTLGLIAGNTACEVASKKALEFGISITATTGFKGTTGALGHYARILAKQNLVSIITCSSEYAVAPWGGKDAILGTNPIAISIPNEDNPIIIDFATSAMSYGDLMLAAEEGREVSFGVVLDENGNPSTNPMDAENGCQLPMAGHKGYALGLAVEILAGLFIGAKSGKDAVQGTDGLLIIAFKPDLFVPQNAYLKNLMALINEITSSDLAPGFNEIRLPGKDCLETIKKKRDSGICNISEVVYNRIIKEWEKISDK